MNLTIEPPVDLFNTTTVPKFPSLVLINSIIARKFLPLTVVLWIYLVIGVLGNSLVMFVYWARKKPVREDRYFIPILALADLASCVVSSSTGIYAQTYPLMFDDDVGCKMAAFLGILLAGVSANFLVAIAAERYLKLCRPFGRQMTVYVKKVIIAIMVIISLVFAAPALYIYRAEEVPLRMKRGFEIQTWKCIDMKDKQHEAGHVVYKVLLFVITMVRFAVLLFCYGNIIWVIFRQKRFRLRLGSMSSSASTSVSCSHDVEEAMEMKDPNVKGKTSEHVKESGSQHGFQTPFIGNKPRKQSFSDREGSKRKQSLVSTTGSQGRRGSHADRQGVRLSVIFILITIIYIISFGPKVWLMIEQTLNRNFWSSVPPSLLLLYRFLHTFYIVNNIVNPIVYGIMDKRFRIDCKKRFTKCK
ncbi:cholecystokinin receptor-like [Pecten maximus]|uniref:cholecystokinin receptor-like n=1 Tax=Pecten maximus TaxID=6579 RepID=UPI001458680B|nr:cholecystokinin receptor-like [Pecten maximus]